MTKQHDHLEHAGQVLFGTHRSMQYPCFCTFPGACKDLAKQVQRHLPIHIAVSTPPHSKYTVPFTHHRHKSIHQHTNTASAQISCWMFD